MLLPLIAPTEGRTTAYTLSLGFGNEELGLELIGKEGEKHLLLVERADVGDEVFGITIDAPHTSL